MNNHENVYEFEGLIDSVFNPDYFRAIPLPTAFHGHGPREHYSLIKTPGIFDRAYEDLARRINKKFSKQGRIIMNPGHNKILSIFSIDQPGLISLLDKGEFPSLSIVPYVKDRKLQEVTSEFIGAYKRRYDKKVEFNPIV